MAVVVVIRDVFINPNASCDHRQPRFMKHWCENGEKERIWIYEDCKIWKAFICRRYYVFEWWMHLLISFHTIFPFVCSGMICVSRKVNGIHSLMRWTHFWLEFAKSKSSNSQELEWSSGGEKKESWPRIEKTCLSHDSFSLSYPTLVYYYRKCWNWFRRK